jgi:hypothetical protein
VIVAGSLIVAAGVWYLSRIPVHGTYPGSLLPGLVIMAIGIGAVLVSGTTAANAGIPADKAGLAAGLLNASQQLGTALGLAIFSAIATVRTSTLIAARAPGMPRSPLGSTAPTGTHVAPGQVPAPELADQPSSAATPASPGSEPLAEVLSSGKARRSR